VAGTEANTPNLLYVDVAQATRAGLR